MDDEPRITSVPPLGMQHKPPQEVPKKVDRLPEAPIEFTLWERITLSIDNVVEKTVTIVKFTPHIVSLFWALKMKNSTKLITAITGLIFAVCGHFAIELPEPLPYVIDGLVTLLIGWLIPAPKNPDAN